MSAPTSFDQCIKWGPEKIDGRLVPVPCLSRFCRSFGVCAREAWAPPPEPVVDVEAGETP